MATKFLVKALEELGLVSLWSSTLDVKLLCAQRFVRLFAYGGSTLILVAYLSELGISKEMIGLFMTLTLIGDTVISLVLTLFADGLGRKAILALGAALMAMSGVVFALSTNQWILLVAAIVGVISPKYASSPQCRLAIANVCSGNEIGPFRAVEESTLAHLTPTANRGDIYAWYSLIGTAGTAVGMVTSGWAIQYMRSNLKWDVLRSYRMVFWGYAIFGIIKFILSITLSKNIEAEKKPPPTEDTETAPLLGDGSEEAETKKSYFRSLIPDISAESRIIVVNICILFMLDAFGSSLAPQ